MLSKIRLLAILAFAMVAVACTLASEPDINSTPSETAATVPADPVESLAPVDSAELIILESFPIQINLDVAGTFTNDCSTIERIDQTQGGNSFAIDVVSLSPNPADATCLPVPTPFNETIALDVEGLLAGTYVINVNGVMQSFTFAIDNILQPPTTEPPAPTVAPTEAPVESSRDSFTVTGNVRHDLCAISEDGSEASSGCVASADGGFVANGVEDADEPPLVGVEVSIAFGACPGGESFATTATDADGNYAFPDIRPGSYCVTVPAAADPNATILIPGQWTAPNADGQQTIEVADDVQAAAFGWDYQFLPNFGSDSAESNPDTILNDPGCIHLAAFDGDITVPDDTPFEVGADIRKVWRFINTGSCGWGPGYSLEFVDGEQMSAPNKVDITDIILPGEAIEIQVNFIAPEELGTYRSNWQFVAPNGEVFGIGEIDEPVWAQIEVVEPNTLGSISGLIWNDLCNTNGYEYGISAVPENCALNENGTIRGDGFYDTTREQPIADVRFELGTGACGDALQIARTYSNSDGQYRFSSLAAGTYCVYVEILTPFNFPILIPGDFTAPSPSRAGITVNLEINQDVDNANFGWDFAE